MAAQTKKSNRIAKPASASRRANPVMFEPVAEFDQKAAGRNEKVGEAADDSAQAAAEATAFYSGAEAGAAHLQKATGITKRD